jgi:protein SCO1/2
MTFIYTECPDICPLLTQKMAQVQDELGADFGKKIAFVSITLDPAHDTPECRVLGRQTRGLDVPDRRAGGGS